MAKYQGSGEGGSENPPVHSKAGTNHGMPREAPRLGHRGESVDEHPLEFARHAPSASHGNVHRYAPNHPAMAGMEHGAKAVHPYNDAKQQEYEHHGYTGNHNEDKR